MIRATDNGIPPPQAFDTTHWSVVLVAADAQHPESQEAWERLARVYWYPLYAYIRRRGHEREVACDFTQAFVTRLIERHSLEGVVPGKGRFRSFLLVCLNNYLKDEAKRANRERRCPRGGVLSFDEMQAEQRYLAEPVDGVTPAVLFERRCARAVLDQALFRLEKHYRQNGKCELFEHLAAHLTGDPESLPFVELAAKLGMTPGAVRTEMHRLRRRLEWLFREEVAATVEAKEVEEEMRHISAVFSG